MDFTLLSRVETNPDEAAEAKRKHLSDA